MATARKANLLISIERRDNPQSGRRLDAPPIEITSIRLAFAQVVRRSFDRWTVRYLIIVVCGRQKSGARGEEISMVEIRSRFIRNECTVINRRQSASSRFHGQLQCKQRIRNLCMAIDQIHVDDSNINPCNYVTRTASLSIFESREHSIYTSIAL